METIKQYWFSILITLMLALAAITLSCDKHEDDFEQVETIQVETKIEPTVTPPISIVTPSTSTVSYVIEDLQVTPPILSDSFNEGTLSYQLYRLNSTSENIYAKIVSSTFSEIEEGEIIYGIKRTKYAKINNVSSSVNINYTPITTSDLSRWDSYTIADRLFFSENATLFFATIENGYLLPSDKEISLVEINNRLYSGGGNETVVYTEDVLNSTHDVVSMPTVSSIVKSGDTVTFDLTIPANMTLAGGAIQYVSGVDNLGEKNWEYIYSTIGWLRSIDRDVTISFRITDNNFSDEVETRLIFSLPRQCNPCNEEWFTVSLIN